MKNTVRRAVGGLVVFASAALLSGCYLVGTSSRTGDVWGVRTGEAEQHGDEEITPLTAFSSRGRFCKGTMTIAGMAEDGEEDGEEQEQLVVLACTNEPLTRDGGMRGVEIGLGRIWDGQFTQGDGTLHDGYIVRITWMGSPQDGLNYDRVEEIRLVAELDDDSPVNAEIDRAVAVFPRK